jgi:accessory gene regulator B
MERIAQDISEKIARELNCNTEKKDVIAYGLTAIFQLLIIGITVSLIGLVFKFLYESLVIFLCVALIKKSTGGAHSNSIYICTFISIFTITLFAYISRYILYLYLNIYLDVGILVIVYIASFLIFTKHVPVDSPNKPITKPEKIKRLRKQSFIILFLYFLVSLLLFYFEINHPRLYSISLSMQLAVIWQTFMLTKLGAKFINIIDTKFIKKGAYEK